MSVEITSDFAGKPLLICFGSDSVSPTLKYLGGRSKASLWLAIDETFPVENVFSGQWDTQPKAEPNQ